MAVKTLSELVLVFVGIVGATITMPDISPTPPMGFNNWARFMCDLNETLFLETAESMKSRGLLAAGYDQLNMDDCWMQHTRAPNGSLQWNTTLFPHGIPWLAEQIKSRGFNFGIYEDSGNETCGGFPGSKGYERLDVETFSSWGIDYLKLDGCNVQPDANRTLEETYQRIYGEWHQILSSLPDPLVFSESAPAYFSGGSDFPGQLNKSDWYRSMKWAPLYGELARHGNDIDVYGYYEPHEYWESIMTNYGFENLLARYQQPGFYNDPDFIIADWPWLTLDEKKSQFALWASFSAPLILSAFVPDLTDAEVAYLTNEDIIDVDQDALGLQATLVSQDGAWDVLTKSLSNGDRLLTVLNRGNVSASTNIAVERIGLSSGEAYTVKDLWTGSSTTFNESVQVTLNSHATAIYRISDVSCVTPTGMIFNSFVNETTPKCVTASNTTLIFTNCTASDSQVWQVSAEGNLSPLSSPAMCVSDIRGSLKLSRCKRGRRTQQWTYHITGNLVNKATKRCLTDSPAGVNDCGEELDSQVFALPSGVQVTRHGQSPGHFGSVRQKLSLQPSSDDRTRSRPLS